MAKATVEQQKVLDSKKKKMIVSASAGSGKTFVLIEYITNLVCKMNVPVKRLLVLTFTRASANEMRERLNKSILAQKQTPFLIEQIDDLSISDISTIDSFCEKVIRRNLDLVGLDEDFKILDNEVSETLKAKAFAKTIESMADSEEYKRLYFSFRRNKESLFESVKFLYDFFASQKDSNALIEKILNCQDEIYNSAVEVLDTFYQQELKKINDTIELALDNASDKYLEYVNAVKEQFQLLKNHSDFTAKAETFSQITLPRMPSLTGEQKDEEQAQFLKKIKNRVDNLKKFCSKFVISDEGLKANMQTGLEAISLIRFYQQFENFYNSQKFQIDGLDFADIEKMCLSLLEREEVLKSLQEKYDYIFIDEYQDTNFLQASIVKPIAQGGQFIAVGDLKQGIYGFRNASMEIMQQDIKNFSSDDEGEALFLRGNFRSEKGILEFVNKVFSAVMTEKEVGVDYKQTSLLEGLAPYEKQNFPSVVVDVIKNEEEVKDKIEKVYSVEEDELYVSNKYKSEVDAIIARIDKMLTNNLFDLSTKSFRRAQYNDITVLFRNRSPLMSELALKLQKKGFPVICEAKSNLLSEPEIEVIRSLISLSINFADDIALATVMLSKLGGFTLEEVAEIQNSNEQKFLHKYLSCSSDNKIQSFKKDIEKFSKDCQIFGVTKALEIFFNQKDYYAYLAYQEDGDERTHRVLAFLSEIVSSGFDNDRAGLLAYLSSINEKSHSGQGGDANAITLTTIHASKGLEYPFVILAGCGEKLEKPNKRPYAINPHLGLGTNAFNYQNNFKCTTPVFEAIKLENKKREFVDEIMIFYVALTRAKNHLYIVGKECDCEDDLFDNKTYLSLIFYSFGENILNKLKQQKTLEIENWQFNFVDSVQPVLIERDTSLLYKPDDLMTEEIEKVFDFVYPNENVCKLNYKNSVTSIVTGSEFDEQNMDDIIFDEQTISDSQKLSRQQAIDRGIAHHEALRKIDFEKVDDMESLENQIKNSKICEKNVELLDKKLLLENILKLKTIAKGKLFKENEFVMRAKLCDISPLQNTDEVLVQGAVDLLCLGEENILIDYKFTSQKNKEKIIEKYKKQIDLYSLAIEKAFNIKLSKKYIFSLKNNEFFEIN